MTVPPTTLRGGRIAIVIPVFKHSGLVQEAIASVFAQNGEHRPEIIIVDDGCPIPQTMLTLAALPEIHENVHYIRQINGGLSAARNCGIRFVLERLPDCRAIYFLDADNRLSLRSLDQFEVALSCSNADWFYPDIRMFGMPWKGDYSGPFRRMTEMFMNLCEAGSLIRRRVFEAGVLFDERMRDGYEDWEFWLEAIQHGFRGEHLPSLGLQYRKRAESMLAESARLHGAIINYIEKKHSWLRDLGVVGMIEHLDAPRYAVLDPSAGTVRLTSDPDREGEMLSLDDYRARLRASFARPSWYAVASFIVVTSGSVLAALRRHGLARFAFWNLEQQLLQDPLATIALRPALDGRLRVETRRPASCEPLHVTAFSMQMFRSVIQDSSDIWISKVPSLPEDLPIRVQGIDVPDLDLTTGASTETLTQAVEFCRGERAVPYPPLWSASHAFGRGSPDVAELPLMSRVKFGVAVMANTVGPRSGRVAFVLPIYEFGGVEKVAFFVARSLRRAGYQVDLFVLGQTSLQPHERQIEAFDHTFFLNHKPFNSFGGSEFLGTALPNASYPSACEELTNLLSVYEIVIGSHAADLLGSFAALRTRGVLTVNYLHLLEYTQIGRAVGHVVLGLAYEHSTDLYLTCSERLSQELGMLGIPGDKIVTVPNAGGMNLAAAAARDLSGERQARTRRRAPLRVLYLGRLDRQKGLDRVAAIFEALMEQPDRFELSIVGSSVVDGDVGLPDALADITRPAVHAEAELRGLYVWADVIILPSRYEGVPLTIIEAQAHGTVPVVTRVGAIEEVVTDGVDGFVVGEENAIAGMISILQDLETDRALLSRISDQAVRAGAGRDWDTSIKPMLAAIGRIIKAKPRPRLDLTWLDAEFAAREASSTAFRV